MTVQILKSEFTAASTMSPGEFNIINVYDDGTLLIEATADAKRKFYNGTVKYMKYSTKTYRINAIKDGGLVVELVEVVEV